MDNIGPVWLLALDFGGTKHTAAILPWDPLTQSPTAMLECGWQGYQRVFCPPDADMQYDLQTMKAMAHELIGDKSLAAIGVSFGGPVDISTGNVLLSNHVPGWENFPLEAFLRSEFGVPARIDNDANVAALGEYHFGAGQGLNGLFYITVSTGVGGGWILNGKPWRGAQNMAGEIGHMVVDPEGPQCLCGKRGCVERLASGPYMAADACELLLRELQQAKGHANSLLSGDRGGTLLALAGGDPQTLTGAHLSQAASMGDALAWEILERSAWALGVSIGNTANLINPQRFILGGGVTKSGERFWQTIQRTARQTALPQIQVEIVPAILGDDAPLWGAVALAQDCLAE